MKGHLNIHRGLSYKHRKQLRMNLHLLKIRIIKTQFSKTLVSGIVVSLLLAGCVPQPETRSNLSYVDPHIGGMGHLLQPTRPNVQLPNQMIRMHPFRNDYLDDQISFFPLTIMSHRQGELFGIMPYSCSVDDEMWKVRQMYDHDLEIVNPYYYSTYFIDVDIRTEFTPGTRTGYFKFTFPENNNKLVKLQINQAGEWHIISGNTISGEEVFHGMKAYVYGEFNMSGNGTLNEQIRVNTRKKTSNSEPVVLFEFLLEGDHPIEFKYGVSFISVEQARANLESEIPDWDFEILKERGLKAWSDKLDRIQVKGGTDAQRRTFYTSLYRCYERMVNINEDGRYYSAYDHQVHESDRPFYVD
ncbi:MAG: glycoside hydrolase family 92 protein, partial [Spirochaetales bacterium]|nr:glycoside hydrolase family 92 protein [Spirochaetales bacterium]